MPFPGFGRQFLKILKSAPFHRGTAGDCWKAGLLAGIDGGTGVEVEAL